MTTQWPILTPFLVDTGYYKFVIRAYIAIIYDALCIYTAVGRSFLFLDGSHVRNTLLHWIFRRNYVSRYGRNTVSNWIASLSDIRAIFWPSKGDPNAEKGSIDRQNYEEGLRMGSLGLFTQNIIAMFSSFYIDALILKFGKRNVFLLSTVSSTLLFHD